MADRRIYYLTDNTRLPTGGALVARQHVQVLRRNGFDARLLVRRDEGADFFDFDLPRQPLTNGVELPRGSVLVIPEPWHDMLLVFERYPSLRKVVFCQNHHYVFLGLGQRPSYAAFGVAELFCCGESIARFLDEVLGLPDVPVVHNAIDPTLFRPGRKTLQVAYMPRKMHAEPALVRGILRRRHPRLADVPWVPLKAMPQREVARVLGESAVFLSLARLEGLGLPPLEAMAAGCLVTGFLGGGGRDYATRANGLWCRPEDWAGCADAVARALALAAEDGPATAAILAAGRATAAAHGPERMERELLAYWQGAILR